MFKRRTHLCNATPIAEMMVEPLNGDTHRFPKSGCNIETYNIVGQNLKPFGSPPLRKAAWI